MTVFRHKITGKTQDLPDHFRAYDFLEEVASEDPCASCTLDVPEPETVAPEPEPEQDFLTEPVARRIRDRKRS